MHYTAIAALLATLSTSISAIPNPFIESRQAMNGFFGVATFNDYVDQVNNRNQKTVCGDFNDDEGNNIFAAAAGDLSPDISPGECDYRDYEWNQDPSFWYALPFFFSFPPLLPCTHAMFIRHDG